MRTPVRAAVVLALVALFAAPAVLAQSQILPVEGNWQQNYFVFARVVDKDGFPAVNEQATVTFRDVAATVKPTVTTVTCAGDLEISFPFHDIERSAQVVVTIDGKEYVQTVDTHYRRSEFLIQTARKDDQQCGLIYDVWYARYTFAGRIVESGTRYEDNGTAYFAKPLKGRLFNLTIVMPDGRTIPQPPNEHIVSDAFGDFKYSFVLTENFTSGKVIVETGRFRHEHALDALFRNSFEDFDVGDRSFDKTPFAGSAALAVAALAAALLLSVRRRP